MSLSAPAPRAYPVIGRAASALRASAWWGVGEGRLGGGREREEGVREEGERKGGERGRGERGGSRR